MKRDAKMILLLSDARGQYIPRDFAREVHRWAISGVDQADLDYLARGPGGLLDNDEDSALVGDETVRGEFYWDVWEIVVNNAVVTDDKGQEYFVYQDGDCWLIEKGAEFYDRPVPGCSQDWVIDDGQAELNLGDETHVE